MKKRIIILAVLLAACCLAIIIKMVNKPSTEENPFLQPYTNEYGIPPFDKIKYEHYLPALKAGIEQQKAEIEAIVSNPEPANFDNTIMALERSGETLDKVGAVFFALDESNSSPEMVEIAETFYPEYTKFADEMTMNDALFARIKQVYDTRDEAGLAPDQKLAVENTTKTSPATALSSTPTKKNSSKR